MCGGTPILKHKELKVLKKVRDVPRATGGWVGSGSEAVPQHLHKGKSKQVFKRQTKLWFLKSKICISLKTPEILQGTAADVLY